ncbi:MAG: SRPBCC domain-containing protein [Arthrobacter sp.]
MPHTDSSLDTAAERVSISWHLDASPDQVWWGLTDPEALPQWIGRLVSGQFETGSTVIIEHAEDYCCTSRILDCAPESLLAMTWDFPDEPVSRLRMELTPAGTGTQLVLRHEALGTEAGSYLPGWHTHLLYLDGVLAGEPRPMAEFWATYKTVTGASQEP